MKNKILVFLNSYDGGTFLGMLILIICLLFYHNCSAQEISGDLSILGNIDVTNKSEDPNSHLQYFGGTLDSDNAFVSASMDSTETLKLREAYIKFNYDGLLIHIGKVAVPFGYMNLDDPSTSVFILYPRKDYRDYGLHLSTMYDIVKFEGAYIDHANYSIKSKLILLCGGEVISISYANSEYLKELILNNEFYFSSLLFNMSNVLEWCPDNGDFWIRSVFAPGIFDVLGLTLGYYHLDYIEQTLQDYDLTGDAWTYGCYLDFSTHATVSTEWVFGESINKPTVKLVAKF